MTFGLNRPVFAFGLMAAGVLFISGGECGFTVEDARTLVAERMALEVEDVRVVTPSAFEMVMDEFEPRIFYVHDFRTFDVYNERTLIAEDERIFVTERKCDGNDPDV